jgi:hypothetical protein
MDIESEEKAHITNITKAVYKKSQHQVRKIKERHMITRW